MKKRLPEEELLSLVRGMDITHNFREKITRDGGGLLHMLVGQGLDTTEENAREFSEAFELVSGKVWRSHTREN